jgi:hypothetical protein
MDAEICDALIRGQLKEHVEALPQGLDEMMNGDEGNSFSRSEAAPRARMVHPLPPKFTRAQRGDVQHRRQDGSGDPADDRSIIWGADGVNNPHQSALHLLEADILETEPVRMREQTRILYNAPRTLREPLKEDSEQPLPPCLHSLQVLLRFGDLLAGRDSRLDSNTVEKTFGRVGSRKCHAIPSRRSMNRVEGKGSMSPPTTRGEPTTRRLGCPHPRDRRCKADRLTQEYREGSRGRRPGRTGSGRPAKDAIALQVEVMGEMLYVCSRVGYAVSRLERRTP